MRPKNTTPNIHCDHCGKPFFKEPSQIARTLRHYCSRTCLHQGSRNQPNVVCETCGTPFHKSPSVIRKKPRHYCSPECYQRRGYAPPVDNGDGTATVPLTKGMVALIDAANIDLVAPYTWYASLARGDRHYAKANTPTGGIFLHRLILGFPSQQVDHVSGDTLDNRRENLRVATPSENNRNRPALQSSRSGYKGVERSRDKWTARIASKGKRYYLGTFDTPEDAARAYDAAAVELHGEFAHLNLPD